MKNSDFANPRLVPKNSYHFLGVFQGGQRQKMIAEFSPGQGSNPQNGNAATADVTGLLTNQDQSVQGLQRVNYISPASPENLGSLGQKLCLRHRKHFCLGRPGSCRPWPDFGIHRRSSPYPSAVLRRDLGGPERGWNAFGFPMLFSPVKGSALHVFCS